MSSDDLTKAISDSLRQYEVDINNAISKSIDKTSNAVVKSLKNDSSIPQRTGKYKKGFYIKKVANQPGNKTNIIANREYQLTHLLEKGHKIVRKGRLIGKSKAYPHWKEAQQLADKLTTEFEKELNK